MKIPLSNIFKLTVSEYLISKATKNNTKLAIDFMPVICFPLIFAMITNNKGLEHKITDTFFDYINTYQAYIDGVNKGRILP